jgi:hypothetical protein
MEGPDRKQLARQLYESFSAGDRAFFESRSTLAGN